MMKRAMQASSVIMGLQMQVLKASTNREIDAPFDILRASAPMPRSLVPTYSSSAALCNLPPLRHATECQRLIQSVNMSWPVGS